MDKANLTQIDKENWKFILYETTEGKWIGDFVYSPQSFVDLSMLIELTDSEKALAKKNRQFLIDFSETIRNNYNDFFKRALNRDRYTFSDSQ